MRNYIDIINEAATGGKKIDGSAFIYLAPKAPKTEFAQCKTCFLFKPDSERCGIFAPDVKVTAEQSCGLYLHGKPNENQECRSTTTPEAAGLVDGPVRCENCRWYDNGCRLYEMLSQKMPDVFKLDPNVDPQGCCNAFQKKA
jgi:hypothetical protein